jgi:hypothetical protein
LPHASKATRTCGLCRARARRWQAGDGRSGECLPAQAASVRERFPDLSPQALATVVHLVDTDGGVYSGAEAIIRASARAKTLVDTTDHGAGKTPFYRRSA